MQYQPIRIYYAHIHIYTYTNLYIQYILPNVHIMHTCIDYIQNKFLLVAILYVRRVAEPANQEMASTATPELIHNNIYIIEIDEFTTTYTLHT